MSSASIFGAGLLTGTAALAWLAQRQRRSLQCAVDAVVSAARSRPPSAPATSLDAALPAPVQRYLRHVLPEPSTMVHLARYTQTGALRTHTRSRHWLAFKATQWVAPAATAFVWDARVQLLPLLHVRVRDSLVGGFGSGQVALMSALPLARTGANLPMNSGALHRFLAEAVWYPSALLPSEALHWSPIDDTSALATLREGDVSVSLEFRFNARDEVAAIFTPARWGAFDGGYRQAAWEGHFGSCTRHAGVAVPGEGEVGWYGDDGQWQAVWRGAVAAAQLDLH